MLKALVEADVFTNFLEQAEELFDKKYDLAAAVVAGSVLEDALRKLCDRHNIVIPDPKDASLPKKTATMSDYNMALMKAGVYEKTTFKQVDTSATIRNHAAHGERVKFTPEDVRILIQYVSYFMATYFAGK